ncbi:MAG: ABC transporter permease [bacterium]
MLKNYLKIALRNLARHKLFALLNLAGLVIGISTCLLIMLHVRYELSYDRHLQDADRIFRLVTTDKSAGNIERTALTTANLAPLLAETYSDLQVTRLYYWFYGDVLVGAGDRRFNESRYYRADSTFLNVFAFELLHGDRLTALRNPYSIIITAATARKYFGDQNPVGAQLQINNSRTFTVTGVVRDLPPNTHFKFDFIAFDGRGFPDEWSEKEVWTYFKIPAHQNAATLAQQLPALVERHFPENLVENISFALQPLTHIHLDSHLDHELEPNGNRIYLYVFSAVAIILLLIACINYMNLATARATRRAQEVSVRKAVGASRRQLVVQYLGESVLMCLLAIGLSLVIVGALRETFGALSGVKLPPLNRLDGTSLLVLSAIAICTGLLAGSYPALYLSSFAPMPMLKSTLALSATAGALRKGLVVFQFAATIVLLVGTLVVYKQIQFMLDEERGVDRENIMMVTVPRAVAVDWNWSLEVFRHAVLLEPGVLYASAVAIPWDRSHEQHRVRSASDATPPEVLATLLWVADDDYADLYGLTLLEGRTQLRRRDLDSTSSLPFEFVLNETAARRLGLKSPIGRDLQVAFGSEGGLAGRVVGLVRDFHFKTLHHEIQPLLFVRGSGVLSVAIRLAPTNLAETVEGVAAVWQRLVPGWPFDYTFLNDNYRNQYHLEQRAAKLISAFALLAIVTACLGLFGLAAFMAEQRTKEIGIRKVLGASVSSVVTLLSRDFVKLILLGNLIAWPAAFFAMNKWLENFAYRIDLGWWMFALAGGLALLIALLTVSTQAIKAALANPVEALRYE